LNDLTKSIINEVIRIKPQLLLPLNLLGISKHLDHIAISHATTLAFYTPEINSIFSEHKISGKPHQALKLLYYVIPQSYLDKLQLEFRSVIRMKDHKRLSIFEMNSTTKIAALKCHRKPES